MADQGGLGGASFKVTADAGSFLKILDESRIKASTSSKAIATSFKEIGGAYELAAAGVGVNAAKVEQAMDRQVAAAVEATRAQRLMRQALDETAVAQTHVAMAAASSSTAVVAAGAASRTSALGFLYLSQAVEDAQYGFSAIVNNIPLIVMSMGGSAGVAGAVSIVAVALNIALNHWEQLANAFRSGAEREVAEQMKSLAEKTEQAAKAFEHLKDAKTASQQAAGAGITEAITGRPGGAEQFQKHLSDALRASGQDPSISVGFMEALGIGAQSAMSGTPAAQIVEQKRAAALAGKSAAMIVAAAAGDPAARSQIAAIMKRNPNAFSAEERQAMGLQGNEAANKDLSKEAIDNQNKAVLGQIERKREAEKENAKRIEDLDQAGKENQKITEETAKRHRLEDLADQQTKIHDQMRFRMENLDKIKEGMGQTQIIGGGAKAVVDMFQKAAGDAPLVAIQKAIKALQEQGNKDLAIIAKEIVKEQRVRPT